MKPIHNYSVFYSLNDMTGLVTEVTGTDVLDALDHFKKYIEVNFHVTYFSVQAIRREHNYR
jgi:predicted transcriptional regulator